MKSNKNVGVVAHTNRMEKAITLIALVITIIILLILAGVAINFTLRRKWNIKKSRICSR